MCKVIGRIDLPESTESSSELIKRAKIERCTVCGTPMPFGGTAFSDDVLCDTCIDEASSYWDRDGSWNEG